MHIREHNYGVGHCATSRPAFWATAQSKKVQKILKSRNQIIIKHACEEAYAAWHFSIILIGLRVEVAHISDFFVHAKVLPL